MSNPGSVPRALLLLQFGHPAYTQCAEEDGGARPLADELRTDDEALSVGRYRVVHNTDCGQWDLKRPRCAGRKHSNMTVAEMEACCSSTDGCAGFNSHGFFKRTGCEDHEEAASVDLYLRDGPTPPTPAPPGPPAPAPPPPPPPPAHNGSVCPDGAVAGSGCFLVPSQCEGRPPPFGAPSPGVVQNVGDWHYPDEEPAEAAAMAVPVLVSTSRDAARLRGATGQVETIAVGQSTKSGWELLHASTTTAVVERRQTRWSAVAFLEGQAGGTTRVLRSPVGRLDELRQPRYEQTDRDASWSCKQAADPGDYLRRIAQNMSGGEETTFAAAASVMAPNTNTGVLGNPVELNKFTLSERGSLGTFGPGGSKKHGPHDLTDVGRPSVLLSIHDYMPAACPGNFSEHKLGLWGGYLRVVAAGLYDAGSGCAGEVVAVSPPPASTQPQAVSVALVRIVTSGGNGTQPATHYVRARVNSSVTSVPDGIADQPAIAATLLGLDRLPDGSLFYAAVAAQSTRWGAFAAEGAVAALPDVDRRYGDTALALLTQFLNVDRGFTPEYGAGKFHNTRNEFLPMDTQALVNALLEWGKDVEARQYLGNFLEHYVNESSGLFIMGPYYNSSLAREVIGFGHGDSDADYGRCIQLFCHTVLYSGDLAWATTFMPRVKAMANVVLAWHANATASFPPGHPLHGIHRGPPEADFNGDHSYFFNHNVWSVRGLLELHRLLRAFPTLSSSAVWEDSLLEIANVWRSDIDRAANYTAVRERNGTVRFLHPCVGLVCDSVPEPAIQPGGASWPTIPGTSFQRGIDGNYKDKLANYANCERSRSLSLVC